MSFFYLISQGIISTLNSNPLPLVNGPSVSILIVGYREEESIWRRCLQSIKAQHYEDVDEIVVSIDGDEREDYEMYEIAMEVLCDMGRWDTNVTIMNNIHGGKRSAMWHGLHHIISCDYPTEYVMVTDSDTILDADATGGLVSKIDVDEYTGAVTGSLMTHCDTFLNKLINARYAYAFNLERAAMSYTGCVNCCSGPISIYRSHLLTEDFLESFLYQEYYGQICGPGDDRHLTSLILLQGYRTQQTSCAKAYTGSPSKLNTFLSQQIRWIRSFYREVPWQVRAIGDHHPSLALITHFEILYPFFIISWILFSLTTQTRIFEGGILALSLAISRTVILFFKMDFDMLMVFNVLYIPLYVTCILPLKVYSVLTIREMSWMKSDNAVPLLFICLWNITLSCSFLRFLIHSV